jgi:hypothetical protein
MRDGYHKVTMRGNTIIGGAGMKRACIIGVVLALLAALVPFIPAVAGQALSNAAWTGVRADSYSYNWAGYAVPTTAGAVTDVTGSWMVPTVTGTSTAYSVIWVGIDGYSSNTVEQIGTEQDIIVTRTRHGTIATARYSAWYEMYPKSMVSIPLTISPGDSITAEVNSAGSLFSLTLTDNTTGKTFTTNQTASSAKRSSAEWIVEAPSSWRTVLPLANFGVVDLTEAQAAIGSEALSYANSYSNAIAIDMVNSRGQIIAQTSGLITTNHGDFTVTYVTPSNQPMGRGSMR